MAIFVTGDTHGPDSMGIHSFDGFMPRFNMISFPEQRELTKEDVVIICGDFGGVWDTDPYHCTETPREKYELDWLDNKNFTTLFVPGNHENYNRLTGCKDEKLVNSWMFAKYSEADKARLREGYPQRPWHGGTVRVIRSSVMMAEPGVFDICGKKCFCYGGAPSHDIEGGVIDPSDYPTKAKYKAVYKKKVAESVHFRVRGLSWWEQENPGPEAEQAAMAALERVNRSVDFIFTHDCAVSNRVLMEKTVDARINHFLEEVKQNTEYKHWFFGHFHSGYNFPGGKEHLIYEQVCQIA